MTIFVIESECFHCPKMTYHLERNLPFRGRSSKSHTALTNSLNDSMLSTGDSSVHGKTIFPNKLWDALNSPSNILHWEENGKSFCIPDLELFEKSVMQRYPGLVAIPTFANFRRQCRWYNFHAGVNDDDEFIFTHPSFQKDKEEMLMGVLSRKHASFEDVHNPDAAYIAKNHRRSSRVKRNQSRDNSMSEQDLDLDSSFLEDLDDPLYKRQKVTASGDMDSAFNNTSRHGSPLITAEKVVMAKKKAVGKPEERSKMPAWASDPQFIDWLYDIFRSTMQQGPGSSSGPGLDSRQGYYPQYPGSYGDYYGNTGEQNQTYRYNEFCPAPQSDQGVSYNGNVNQPQSYHFQNTGTFHKMPSQSACPMPSYPQVDEKPIIPQNSYTTSVGDEYEHTNGQADQRANETKTEQTLFPLLAHSEDGSEGHFGFIGQPTASQSTCTADSQDSHWSDLSSNAISTVEVTIAHIQQDISAVPTAVVDTCTTENEAENTTSILQTLMPSHVESM